MKPTKVGLLDKKQRWTRAKKEYGLEMVKFYNKLKKKFKFEDEWFDNILDGWNETGLTRDIWEDGLYRIQDKIERKYNVSIEHEDDVVKIRCWS